MDHGDGGVTMGRHGDDTRSRGVARWLVFTVIGTVVAVVALVTYISWLRSDSNAANAPIGCTGSVRVEVAASSAATAVSAAAAAFNATDPEARGTCVRAHVTAIPSRTVSAGLAAGWTGLADPEPAVWIPDTTAALAEIATAAAGLIAGHSDSVVAASPVVLAVADPPGGPVGVARTADFSWSDLMTATDPNAGPKLVDGRPVTLALGDPRVDAATAYALESMLAGQLGGAALTAADVGAASGRLAALMSRSALSRSTDGLLNDLATGSAAFNAVPVLESQLVQYNGRAAKKLHALYPTGPTTGDELTAIGISASWLSATEIAGATDFVRYLSSAPGLAALQGAGLRVAEKPARPTDGGVDRSIPIVALPSVRPAVTTALAAAMGLADVPAGTG